MSAQFRSPRWLRLCAVLLVVGALLLVPVYAGGEDDPAVGGTKGSTESCESVDTGSASDQTPDDPVEPLTDWLLWWLTLGLLL